MRDELQKEIQVNQQEAVQETIPEKSVSALSAFFPRQYDPKKIPMFDMDKASFRVNKIQRIEREYDQNDIAGKMFDFSKSTITQLLKEGYDDAFKKLIIKHISYSKLHIPASTQRYEHQS